MNLEPFVFQLYHFFDRLYRNGNSYLTTKWARRFFAQASSF